MANRRLAPASEQPESFAFSPENAEWAKTQIAKYPEGRQASAVISLLWKAQEQNGGWLPQKAIETVAAELGMPKIRVLEVATFYTMYKRRPVGDYHVGVCTNTLCAVMGGDAILAALKDHLDVENGDTTPDGKVTLEHIECNAACDYAPVMTVNWEFMDNMTPQSATDLVDDLRRALDSLG